MVLRVRFSATGRGSGVPVEQVVFHVIEGRGGRIASFRGFLRRDQAIEAADGLEQRS